MTAIQLERPRRLTCCSCSGDAGIFSQYHNRDRGFGVCRACLERAIATGGADLTGPEIVRCYGQPGIHHEAPTRSAFRVYDVGSGPVVLAATEAELVERCADVLGLTRTGTTTASGPPLERLSRSLVGRPIFAGLIGPCHDGFPDGLPRVRYETPALYKLLSV